MQVQSLIFPSSGHGRGFRTRSSNGSIGLRKPRWGQTRKMMSPSFWWLSAWFKGHRIVPRGGSLCSGTFRRWLHHGDEIQWHCLVFNTRNIPRKPGLVWYPSNISPNHLLQLSYINCWNAKPGSLWGSGRQIAQQSTMTAESRLKRKFKSCSCDTTWDSEIFWL